jgi:hypothetical protein
MEAKSHGLSHLLSLYANNIANNIKHWILLISDECSTAVSTATAPSKWCDGRMTTSSAKFRELDAAIQRQKKTNDKKDAKNSERISHIDRLLHRIDNIDSKLDNVQTDFGQRLNFVETRMVGTRGANR